MTWPQHRRQECSYNGRRTPLSPQECRVLSAMLMRGPAPTSVAILTDALWSDDPDGGALDPRNGIDIVVMRLRRKLPGAISGRHGFGWYLNQFNEMEKAA